MIITNKILRDETGSIAVESVFVLYFFCGLFIYMFQQAYIMTIDLSANKLSHQVATLISQRDVLFGNRSLSKSDLSKVLDYIYIEDKSAREFYDIYVEELGYDSQSYNSVYSSSSSGQQCQIKKRLSEYSFNLKTSFGHHNSMYRVIVCKRVTGVYFSPSEYVVSGISVLPGQHH